MTNLMHEKIIGDYSLGKLFLTALSGAAGYLISGSFKSGYANMILEGIEDKLRPEKSGFNSSTFIY